MSYAAIGIAATIISIISGGVAYIRANDMKVLRFEIYQVKIEFELYRAERMRDWDRTLVKLDDIQRQIADLKADVNRVK